MALTPPHNRWIVGQASSLSPGASSPSSFRGQDARGDRLEAHPTTSLRFMVPMRVQSWSSTADFVIENFRLLCAFNLGELVTTAD